MLTKVCLLGVQPRHLHVPLRSSTTNFNSCAILMSLYALTTDTTRRTGTARGISRTRRRSDNSSTVFCATERVPDATKTNLTTDREPLLLASSLWRTGLRPGGLVFERLRNWWIVSHGSRNISLCKPRRKSHSQDHQVIEINRHMIAPPAISVQKVFDKAGQGADTGS